MPVEGEVVESWNVNVNDIGAVPLLCVAVFGQLSLAHCAYAAYARFATICVDFRGCVCVCVGVWVSRVLYLFVHLH